MINFTIKKLILFQIKHERTSIFVPQLGQREIKSVTKFNFKKILDTLEAEGCWFVPVNELQGGERGSIHNHPLVIVYLTWMN
jgi:hypothetical protein